MTDDKKEGKVARIRKILRAVPDFIGREIWLRNDENRDPRRERSFAILRVLIIAWRGINDNKLFGQAAALSYYSLIGLGPLLAIGIMISSFLLQGEEDRDNLVVEKLTQTLVFLAPPVAEWEEEDTDGGGEANQTRSSPADETDSPPSTASGSPAPPAREAREALNPSVVKFIDQIVQSARSGAVGVIGSLALIIIVIQLITSIEKAFNGIWGVRRGRSWAQRIISYWTIASLGAVLSITAVTLLSATTIVSRFDQLIPGIEYEDINVWAGPLLSIFLLTLVLAVFNRFFPHTTVHWKAAFIGGVIGSLLLLANHSLSFLYVHKVIREQSLYGSVGIIPVLMFGLYLFWLIVLFSCQIAYAVQNVGNLTNQAAWSNVSQRTREALGLACLLFIGRRFHHCESPPTTTEIANHLRVPGQLVNNSLTMLSELGWIRALEPDDDDSQAETRFQPGIPLEKKSLLDFHDSFVRGGNNRGEEILEEAEPLLAEYVEGFDAKDRVRRPISDLFEQPGG